MSSFGSCDYIVPKLGHCLDLDVSLPMALGMQRGWADVYKTCPVAPRDSAVSNRALVSIVPEVHLEPTHLIYVTVRRVSIPQAKLSAFFNLIVSSDAFSYTPVIEP